MHPDADRAPARQQGRAHVLPAVPRWQAWPEPVAL